MIATDTSSLIEYLGGGKGADVEALDAAIRDEHLVLPPVVLTELLSDPKLPHALARTLLELPRLDLKDGFWERAGALRAKVLRRGLRARLADTLIAQICVDHEVALITREGDFRHFVQPAGLVLASR